MISIADSIENIVGKMRKSWLPAIIPFPYMFSKGFITRVIKSWDVFLQNPFNLDKSIILLIGEELTLYHTIMTLKNPG